MTMLVQACTNPYELRKHKIACIAAHGAKSKLFGDRR